MGWLGSHLAWTFHSFVKPLFIQSTIFFSRDFPFYIDFIIGFNILLFSMCSLIYMLHNLHVLLEYWIACCRSNYNSILSVNEIVSRPCWTWNRRYEMKLKAKTWEKTIAHSFNQPYILDRQLNWSYACDPWMNEKINKLKKKKKTKPLQRQWKRLLLFLLCILFNGIYSNSRLRTNEKFSLRISMNVFT